MDKTVGISYGILCDTLEKQAKKQGYILKNVDKLEKLRKSVNMISIHGLLTERQADSVYKKLHNKVIKSLIPLNKESEE